MLIDIILLSSIIVLVIRNWDWLMTDPLKRRDPE